MNFRRSDETTLSIGTWNADGRRDAASTVSWLEKSVDNVSIWFLQGLGRAQTLEVSPRWRVVKDSGGDSAILVCRERFNLLGSESLDITMRRPRLWGLWKPRRWFRLTAYVEDELSGHTFALANVYLPPVTSESAITRKGAQIASYSGWIRSVLADTDAIPVIGGDWGHLLSAHYMGRQKDLSVRARLRALKMVFAYEQTRPVQIPETTDFAALMSGYRSLKVLSRREFSPPSEGAHKSVVVVRYGF